MTCSSLHQFNAHNTKIKHERLFKKLSKCLPVLGCTFRQFICLQFPSQNLEQHLTSCAFWILTLTCRTTRYAKLKIPVEELHQFPGMPCLVWSNQGMDNERGGTLCFHFKLPRKESTLRWGQRAASRLLPLCTPGVSICTIGIISLAYFYMVLWEFHSWMSVKCSETLECRTAKWLMNTKPSLPLSKLRPFPVVLSAGNCSQTGRNVLKREVICKMSPLYKTPQKYEIPKGGWCSILNACIWQGFSTVFFWRSSQHAIKTPQPACFFCISSRLNASIRGVAIRAIAWGPTPEGTSWS